MIVVGLTGSIAMGKSETAKMFTAAGIPVFDADAEVHRLYAPNAAGAIAIAERWPQVMTDAGVDRARLSDLIRQNPAVMKELEQIVHPLVRDARTDFLERHRQLATPVVVLDIPLLFETHQQETVDRVVVVSAPADIQRHRALARPNMTPAKFDAILARQWPDERKRAAADFVVDTSQGLDYARAQVRSIIAQLKPGPAS